MVKKLVIVESPTKARTIRKFLGKNYIVESCMGHIRDLPQSAKDIPAKFKKEKWAYLGVNVDKKFEPVYCIPKSKVKVVSALKFRLKDVDEVILATDEDREGESISWHLIEVLKPKVPCKRMVFHEITKAAIEKSLKEFRDVNYHLVRAQEARRILDRLVGYTISPLLWKKVAYGLSAGRVQSVAVRLVSEREHERIKFKKSSYWGIQGKAQKDGIEFEARMTHYKGQRVAVGKDFDSKTGKLSSRAKQVIHLQESLAKKLVEDLKSQDWIVSSVDTKPISRSPSPPFITSTLQQEANRKLGLSSSHTMSYAQKLYEQGFITYMRTDSTHLSSEAIQAARSCIQNLYKKEYLPVRPRVYSSKKVKGAQEAHEAIRPSGDSFKKPDESGLTGMPFKLYDLIWKRTVASQMKNSEHKQVSVQFDVGLGEIFSASGTTIEFPGFLKAYVEGKDDPELALDSREVHLPKMSKGDRIKCKELRATSHETKPPPRYTEASLIRIMEKAGIGRPSTYATVVSTIQSRGYVKKIGNALMPTFTALVVSRLLRSYLPDYVDTEFTSEMEKSLDNIAQGEQKWDTYLKSIYFGDKGLREQVDKQEQLIDSEACRSIELEGLKGLNFKVGRYGAYVCRRDEKTGKDICASLPENCFPGDITLVEANKLIDQKISGADSLVQHPETGLPIYILTGRYGPYVQMGESELEGGKKPKRVSIPPMIDYESITVEQALKLLELPKTLGEHPETGKVVKVGLGRFGPYVVHDGDFRSISSKESLFDVTFDRALELLSQPKRGRGRAATIKELGEHPDSGEKLEVMSGKYGPYIRCGRVNASLPEGLPAKEVTLAQAVKLLADKMKNKVKKSKVTKKVTKKRTSK